MSNKAAHSSKTNQNTAYRVEKRHEKSHIKRLKKHLLRYKNDKIAAKVLEKYELAL